MRFQGLPVFGSGALLHYKLLSWKIIDLSRDALYCRVGFFPRPVIQRNFQQELKPTSRTLKDPTQGGSHMERILRFIAIALLAVAGSSMLRAQSNPLLGTWNLNVTKSKFDPGPAYKSLTRTVEAQGDGVKYTFEGVAADGTPIAYGFSVQFDGKDNPISGSIPSGADTISAKRTDSNHYVATLKKGGKVIGTSKVTVSKDGKVTTVDSTGTTSSGAKERDLQVYDKQ
jgi:hypothetical protein